MSEYLKKVTISMVMTLIRKHLQAPGIVEMLTSLAFSASAHLCHTFDQVGFQLFWLVSIILVGFQICWLVFNHFG